MKRLIISIVILITIVITTLLLTSCNSVGNNSIENNGEKFPTNTEDNIEESTALDTLENSTETTNNPIEESNTYIQISQEEAKRIMDTEEEYIILDVREQYEFDEGHIKDAILIPYTEIEDKAEEILPQKDALILVYCRSGRRSKIAAESLAKMGYTNVKEFGGIIDWTYDIVQ